MPTFRLGITRFRALDGTVLERSVSIDAETEKAILLKIQTRDKETLRWVPKSLSQIRKKSEISEIIIADWFWEKVGLY